MQLRFVKKGENVFNCGDYGNKFYIIISGLVTISIPFGLTYDQYVARWLKFRDVTLDQLAEEDLRKGQMKDDHEKMSQLRKVYEALDAWY